MVLAAPQDTYLASRAQALHQVESTIVELGTIFQQLAHMVSRAGRRWQLSGAGHWRTARTEGWAGRGQGCRKRRCRAPALMRHQLAAPPALARCFCCVAQVHEQGEMAMRIDENVEDALGNVDAGQAQLLRYLNTISSNRWLILKVFFVLMLFLVFFLVFVA